MPHSKAKAIVLTCWGCKVEVDTQLPSGDYKNVLILPPHWKWVPVGNKEPGTITERPACPECLQILRKWFPWLGKEQDT